MTAELLEGLARAAGDAPHRAAVLLPPGRRRGPVGYRAVTFLQLQERSDAIAAGLAARGIGAGARVALLVPPGEAFFALSFALLKAGAVPVLVDPGIGTARLGRCLGEARPDAFVGVARAHVARAVLRWAPTARRAVVVDGPGRLTLARVERSGRTRLPLHARPRGAGETAAIVFTSGSTGPPKGVRYRHPHFAAQVQLLRKLYDLRPGEVSLATFPPFALFGPALGLTTVVPRMDPTRPASVDPREIVDAAGCGASVMFGSPALLRTVGRWGNATGARLPSLRIVVSAGAPVPPAVVRDVLAMLPAGADVATPYGATEALPVTSVSAGELLSLPTPPAGGVCVGRPVPGIDVAVVAAHDGPLPHLPAPLPPGAIGEVVVRGPVVTDGYVARPEETRRTAVCWDGQRAHRMGDLGWLDDGGRLWFCGRVAHRVHTAAGTLIPLPCEQVFTAHPAVARAALVGIGEPGAQEPVMWIEPQPGVRPSAALSRELLARGGADARTAGIHRIRYAARLPVDIRHNAKIDYAALSRRTRR